MLAGNVTQNRIKYKNKIENSLNINLEYQNKTNLEKCIKEQIN